MLFEVNWKPAPRDLRIFAGVQVAFFAMVSYSIYRHFESWQAAVAVFSVSAVVGIVGQFAPRLVHYVYVAWMIAVVTGFAVIALNSSAAALYTVLFVGVALMVIVVERVVSSPVPSLKVQSICAEVGGVSPLLL